MSPARLDDEVVYARTPAGRREALYGSARFDRAERRLLLMVNGFTPLRSLVDLCPETPDMADIVRDLVSQGFIEPIDAPSAGAMTGTAQ